MAVAMLICVNSRQTAECKSICPGGIGLITQWYNRFDNCTLIVADLSSARQYNFEPCIWNDLLDNINYSVTYGPMIIKFISNFFLMEVLCDL